MPNSPVVEKDDNAYVVEKDDNAYLGFRCPDGGNAEFWERHRDILEGDIYEWYLAGAKVAFENFPEGFETDVPRNKVFADISL